jgi:Mce-associated membrane protein
MPRQPPLTRRSGAAGIRRPPPRPEPVEKGTRSPEAQAPEASPSQRRKSRDGGVTEPADHPAAGKGATEPADAPARTPSPPPNQVRMASILLAAALVFIGLAWWFGIEDNRLGVETSNTALLDVTRTSQVNQAATSAVETLFSYDFNDIAKTQDAAKDLLLNDDVRNRYNSLMGEVQRLAPQQKMVVTVKASRSAVVMLQGDDARVMVFVDQTATRTDQNQTNSGSAQLWVSLHFTDGKWKLAGLDTYKPLQPTATPPGR